MGEDIFLVALESKSDRNDRATWRHRKDSESGGALLRQECHPQATWGQIPALGWAEISCPVRSLLSQLTLNRALFQKPGIIFLFLIKPHFINLNFLKMVGQGDYA